MGIGRAAEGMSFRIYAEANDPQLVRTRLKDRSPRGTPAGRLSLPAGIDHLFIPSFLFSGSGQRTRLSAGAGGEMGLSIST